MGQDVKYASHLAVLIPLVQATSGDVLELGTGLFSTPVLHWLCVPRGRRLVSYETDDRYYRHARQYQDPYHDVCRVRSWDDAPIERPWDVVLVDHAPAARRKDEIRRLAPWARYIVVHDTDWYYEKDYGYRTVYPLFRYRWEFTIKRPRSVVLSNFADPAEVLPW